MSPVAQASMAPMRSSNSDWLHRLLAIIGSVISRFPEGQYPCRGITLSRTGLHQLGADPRGVLLQPEADLECHLKVGHLTVFQFTTH
jgi:hypothetical protein